MFSISSLSPRGDEKSLRKVGRVWRVEMIEQIWLQYGAKYILDPKGGRDVKVG